MYIFMGENNNFFFSKHTFEILQMYPHFFKGKLSSEIIWSFEFSRQALVPASAGEPWRVNSNDHNFTSIYWVIYL